MKRFAVVGHPIAHSRSPALHQAFAQSQHITIDYQTILAPLDGFEDVVKQFFDQGGDGLNVTVPFKQQAFELCAVTTQRAQIAQAVNTLWQENGKLHGDNTDGQGLVAALQWKGWSISGCRILILGAGGATRGVIYPLACAGATSIKIANRTLARAEQLVNDIQPFVPQCRLSASSLIDLKGEFDLIINATSASLDGQPLHLPEQLTSLAAYEMAYGKPSDFLQFMAARGSACSDGYSMLVGQAIEAFKIWHGHQLSLEHFMSD